MSTFETYFKNPNATNITVRQLNWKNEGASIMDPIAAANELVTNALDVPNVSRIDISILDHNTQYDFLDPTKRYFCVKNNGKPFKSIRRALENGFTDNDGRNNQFGKGIVNALSKLCPENNGDFAIFSKYDDHYEYVTSPYNYHMKSNTEYDMDKWPFKNEPDVTSCVITRISNDNYNFLEYYKILSETYAMFLKINPDLQIVYNQQIVKPTLPDTYQAKSVIENILGENFPLPMPGVTMHYEMHVYDESIIRNRKKKIHDINSNALYAHHTEKNGVHLFVNHKYIAHLGTKGILTKNSYEKENYEMDPKRWLRKSHSNRLNGVIVLVDFVIDNHEFDFPLKSDKSEVDWHGKNIEAFIRALNMWPGKDIRKIYYAGDEINMREHALELLEKDCEGTDFAIVREMPLSPGLMSNRLRCDTVKLRVTPKNARRISEYKNLQAENPNASYHPTMDDIGTVENPGVISLYECKSAKNITANDIIQLASYGAHFYKEYNYMPMLTLIGKEISAKAMNEFKYFRDTLGYPLKFIAYDDPDARASASFNMPQPDVEIDPELN